MDPRPPAVPTGSPAPAGDGGTVALPAPPRQPLPGDTVGPFRVVRQLGRGGMAVVFEAEDTELPRRVALKVLVDADPQAKLRFVREAHAQAKITHDNVVTIYRVGEDRGVSYIAMPVLNGQSLAQALIATPKPPLPAVIRIASEMAEGLAAAHAAGLIHRDIKPANIWLEAPKWRVKILDFGLVRDPHANTQIDITMQGHVVGTPAYMSPEQAAGHEVDHRTDLWSLGVVLYQMATGKRPFTDDNTVNLMTAIVSAEAPAPLDLAPDLPPALSDLIRRLMSKNPAKRPASAAAVSAALEAVGKALVAPPVVVLSLPSAVPDSPPGENPWGDLEATETDLSRAVPLPTQVARTVADEGDSYDRPPRRPSWRERRADRAGTPKWVWIAGGSVAAVLLVGLLAWALTGGSGAKTTEPTAHDPVPGPRPTLPKVTPPKVTPPKPEPEPDHERQAAEALTPFARLRLLREGEPRPVDVPPNGRLPDGKFRVVSVDFGDTDGKALNATFVANVFLPAVAHLKGLAEIHTNVWQMELSADHLRRLAAMPTADTLQLLWVPVELTAEGVDELKKFRALAGAVLRASERSEADDAVLGRLAELPHLRRLGLTRMGRANRLTHKGWEAVAALPLNQFVMGMSRGAPDALRAFCERGGKLPELKFIACDLTDKALSDYLKPETELRELEVLGGDVSNVGLTTLAGLKNLQVLTLTNTKVAERQVISVVWANRDVRVVFNGKVYAVKK